MDRVWQILRECWRRVHYLVSRFVEDRCSENAAALTYMSLFALVPLLTVLYAIASAVPVFQGFEENLQALLFEHLVPESSSGLQEYINDFSRQAKNLTGAGIAFLLITAVLMLRNIETSFNHIWRARKHRGAVSSFLLYWAILTLTPATLGLALALGTYLSSFAYTLESYGLHAVQWVLIGSLPLALATAGFTLVYVAVPNCHVPFRHALVGGVVAAIAINIARSIFTKFVAGSSITFIYGAFAAVPLFLIWLFISWIIVLMGCVLVHSLSAYQNEYQANRPLILKALDVLYLFWDLQRLGRPVREKDLLGNRHLAVKGLDSETWGELRDIMIENRVITQSEQGHYLLARDLHDVSLWQVLAWGQGTLPLDRPGLAGDLPWQEHALDLLLAGRQRQQEILDISLAELFES